MIEWAIFTDRLTRVYRRPRSRRAAVPANEAAKELVALDQVSLSVRPGELFGLLGTNGAGKTTLIKILTTLLAPTSGVARVDGLDVVSQAALIRPRINMVSGGESCGYGILTVRETLWLFSQLYGVSHAEARRRIDHMLEVVSLRDRADTKISHLSTGLRQKVNFCRGFITDPKILFLDEPTVGLDVTAARAIRAFIRDWVRERPDRTLLLTTHYMMEADQLCDRVAIIDRGRVLAVDTPAALKKRVQRYPTFRICLTPGADGWQSLGRVPGVHQHAVTAGPTAIDLKVSLEAEAVIGDVVQQIAGSGARILTLHKVEPTLEDAFIELCGHGLSDTEIGE
ncbi:MAG: ABC transporter ATP-binding protein [Gemmataceae bacterium]|nr:ABC transporter ATP-binding protein [Gemmataceae bacterium]MDW8265516.1 ABC transporter ATP-binding protein [Gemmataceae bacterium]